MALSYRRIVVDGHPTGMQGLDEIFESLLGEGYRPGEKTTAGVTGDGLGDELVRRAQEHNYIPPGAREAFAAALRAAYRTYVAARSEGGPSARDYGTWRGYPREQIPWFPTINDDLCDGCGLCLRLCSPKALQPTPDGKVEVEDPFRCIVGCSSCARVCRPKAITFPPRSMLKAYRQRR